MESNPRSGGVDVLRGIAILLVLILHFHLTYRLNALPSAPAWLSDAILAIARNGDYGVTIFFTVSGYLIASTSLRRFGSPARIDPRAFYRLRAARILPCLLLALTIMVALAMLGLRSFVDRPGTVGLPLAVLSVLTFWHNLLMARIGYFNYAMNILWSLSVEEVFYLGFPLLCRWLGQPRRLVLVLLVPIVFAPFYRSLHRDDEIVALYACLSCFDAIALGCCAALLPAWPLARGRRVALQLAAALAIVLAYLSGPIMRHVVWGVSAVAAATAVLLYGLRQAPAAGLEVRSGRWPISRPIRWLGQRSYELYLFHIVVLGVLREYLTRENIGAGAKPLWLVAYLVVAALVAQGVFRYVSEPLNRVLRGARAP